MLVPKFSIILITYNSGVYVRETLDSIAAQSFRDFELLICDDGSKDDTVEICRQWVTQHPDIRTKILADGVNRGTSANCNKGIAAAAGEWIKLIAGDDMLHPQCLQRLVDEESKTNGKLYCGEFIPFTEHEGTREYRQPLPTEKQRRFFGKDAQGQFRQLLTDSFNMSPAVFIHCELFKKYGYFDERFRLLEDLPFWIKITENGVKFQFIPHPVAYYRTEHESAVFSQKTYYNRRFMDDLYQFRDKVVYKKVPKSDIVFYQAELMERLNYWTITRIFGNQKTKWSRLASKALLFPTLRRVTKLLKNDS